MQVAFEFCVDWVQDLCTLCVSDYFQRELLHMALSSNDKFGPIMKHHDRKTLKDHLELVLWIVVTLC